MTLRLVLAAYGLENIRPYRIGAGRNNEHWYVGAGLVLRRYGPFRSDAATGYAHPLAGPLRQHGVQLVHGDWHDGNILYRGGTVSGILDFDFAHPDLPLVDVAIAALTPEVEDSAQIAVGYFGARSPAEHELDLIAAAQRARA